MQGTNPALPSEEKMQEDLRRPGLDFDDRDREGVAKALEPFSDVIDGDPWLFAQSLAQKQFETLLAKDLPMTTYLGGKPVDSGVANGVLHPLYRGLGVIFMLTEPSSLSVGVESVSHVWDAPIRPEQKVRAKFWISAATLMTGRYEAASTIKAK